VPEDQPIKPTANTSNCESTCTELVLVHYLDEAMTPKEKNNKVLLLLLLALRVLPLLLLQLALLTARAVRSQAILSILPSEVAYPAASAITAAAKGHLARKRMRVARAGVTRVQVKNIYDPPSACV